MRERDRAILDKITEDGKEIAALVLEHMGEAADAPEASANGVRILLGAAWMLGQRATPDQAEARRLFVEHLREWANAVEALDR